MNPIQEDILDYRQSEKDNGIAELRKAEAAGRIRPEVFRQVCKERGRQLHGIYQ